MSAGAYDRKVLQVDAAGNAVNPQASTGTPTSVPASGASVTLLAPTARRTAVIFNDSTATLWVLAGTGTASSSNFTYEVLPRETVELILGYTGIVSGIWASATGNARITEYTV